MLRRLFLFLVLVASWSVSADHFFSIFKIRDGNGVYGSTYYPVIMDEHYVLVDTGTGTYPDPSMLPEGWTLDGKIYIIYQDKPRGTRPHDGSPPSADYYPGGPYKDVAFYRNLRIPNSYTNDYNFPLWNGDDTAPAYKYPPTTPADATDPVGGFWYPPNYNPEGGGGGGGSDDPSTPPSGGGAWNPPPPPTIEYYNPSEGMKDYGPIISSFRADLLNYLGTKLGTWVYDVKLSNAQLVEMARGSGLKVDASNLPAPVVNVSPPVVNVPAPVVNVEAPVVPAPVVNVEAPVVNVPESEVSLDQSTPPITEPSLDEDPVEISDDEQKAIDTVNGWFQSPDEEHTSAIDTIRSFLDSWVGHIPTVGQAEHWFSVHFDLPHVGSIDKELGWDMFPMITTIRSFLVFCVMLFFVFKIVNLVIKVSQ